MKHQTRALLVSLIGLGFALAALSAFPLAAADGSTDVLGPQTVSATVAMPVDIHAEVTAMDCENSPGPFITLSGELAVGGLAIQLVFQNNAKGTHTHVEELTATAVVIPAGETITFAKQPPLGGVGGNPFIWIQFTDANGHPLSGEIFLGRCVQGLSAADASFVIAALATAVIEGADCSNNPGPFITLSGDISLSGVSANLIFRNNDNPVGGPHEHTETAVFSVELVPPGLDIQFPKQPPLGGVGGNPWIYLRFLDGNGNAISDKILLGRCVQDF